jgi:hypothetical protein|tara:strand:+ start:1305 stop:1925 length:621 start_codon:yes stop_codon:yes gene_type:complete
MLIGLCGYIGSGKNAVAEMLVKNHGYEQDSFAKSLKDAVSAVFGWPRELLEGNTPHSREWREAPDTWWTEQLEMPVSPRLALQVIGTEVFRGKYHNNIWVASLLRRVGDRKVVVSDVRFPNEIKLIQEYGGKVIWVKRDMPEWANTGMEASIGDENAVMTMQKLGIHSSEWAWTGSQFDYTINNDKGLQELEESTNYLVSNVLDAN